MTIKPEFGVFVEVDGPDIIGNVGTAWTLTRPGPAMPGPIAGAGGMVCEYCGCEYGPDDERVTGRRVCESCGGGLTTPMPPGDQVVPARKDGLRPAGGIVQPTPTSSTVTPI